MKQRLQILGFKPKENTSNLWIKTYGSYSITIDFDKQQINYGSKIRSESWTTQNFSQKENEVVLECIDRLLEKWYHPEDIILEKIYPSGHGHSGRLDILVKKEGEAFLMIECKTRGKEFEKELKHIQKDGGQLFTYFQNDTKADYLMLYTSYLDKETIVYKNEIIKIEEHYRTAGNIKDVYERRNKITNNNGIFEDWINAYEFQNKFLIKSDLKILSNDDSSFIFHQFLSILRKYAVSDKSNAFNKIFNLFLAKLYDEQSKDDTDEVGFQWKEWKDDSVEFEVRLIDLHKKGMERFLGRTLEGLTAADIDLKGEDLKKFQKKAVRLSSIFDIKEVIDDDSFEENFRVLKEIVELLQQYQIRYPKKQQHLSDFFERLLTTGLKQEAGQFFTPPPITKFIVKSLPLTKIIEKEVNQYPAQLPVAIDYACGSGHFITELLEEYQHVINKLKTFSLLKSIQPTVKTRQDDPYNRAEEYIYGIEKDSRLVKVAKVWCYFYGDGQAQIIEGDGLDNFEQSKSYRGKLKKNIKNNPQFSIIVSNPPYAVDDCKRYIRNNNAQNDFDLYKHLTDNSKEIEALFIERTKQLLKKDGIAAIILPSSILSNGGIYTKTREILLKYFERKAVVELGSNTFMATGTNTVVLFLQKRNEQTQEKIQDSISKAFIQHKDLTIHGIENPVQKYLSTVWTSLDIADYWTLLDKQPNEKVQQHELFNEYQKKMKTLDDIIAREKEKFLYFILAYEQKLVIVKSGEKDIEKRFLGYGFSNRRGNEWMHPIQSGKTIEECTQLFDENDYENPTKASSYIYKAFAGDTNFPIDESLKDHIFRQSFVEMISRDKTEFEKTISLSVKKKINIESTYNSVRLWDVCSFVWKGRRPASFSTENGAIPFIISSNVEKRCNIGDYNKEALIIWDGGSANIHYIHWEFSASDHTYIIEPNNWTHLKYIYDILSNNLSVLEEWFKGQSLKNISKEYLVNLEIPFPPLEIQEGIMREIKILEGKETEMREKLVQTKQKICWIVNNLTGLVKIKEYFDINTDTINPIEMWGDEYFTYVDIDSIGKGDGSINFDKKLLGKNAPSRARRLAKNQTAIISTVRPYLRGFAFIDLVPEKTLFSTGFALIKSKSESKYITKLIYLLFMFSDNLMKQMEIAMPKIAYPSINKDDIENFIIPLPSFTEQQKIVAEIEKIETEINQLETEVATFPAKKEAILRKWL